MFEARKKKTTLESASALSQASNKNIPRSAQKEDEYTGSGCNFCSNSSTANRYKCYD